MIARYVEELDEVLHTMKSLEEDDDTWYAYLSREKFLRDQISKDYYYNQIISKKDKKLAELKRKSKTNLKIAEIKGMLLLGGELSKIMELTGLSETEILKIKEEM